MNKPKKTKKSKENIKARMPLILWVIIICALIVFTILFIPLLNSIFSKNSFLSSLTSLLTVTNNLGGTVGGILGPIVALLAALLTYWAFMEQVKANRKQAKQFKKQFKDSKISKFESRFFELLKIHSTNKDNFNNFFPQNNGFEKIIKEFSFLSAVYELTYFKSNRDSYSEYLNFFYELSTDDKVKQYREEIDKVMSIILLGKEFYYENFAYEADEAFDFYTAIKNLKIGTKDLMNSSNGILQECYFFENTKSKVLAALVVENNPFVLNGYLKILIPYLNSLSTLFSFIQNEKKIKKNDKRIYFDIIRTMLTSEELIFLYFYFVSNNESYFSKEIVFDSAIFYDLDIEKIDSMMIFPTIDYFNELYSEIDDDVLFRRMDIIKKYFTY